MEFFLKLDIGNESFSAYKIKINNNIAIPFDDPGMDLTPEKVNDTNWIREYQKALYRDQISSYYNSDRERMDDLEETYYINKGDIILVLDNDRHFLGKINYNYVDEKNLMRVMYLYVCGKRRDYFYEKNIKNYPRGAFIMWACAGVLAKGINLDSKVMITYPRYSIFKFLKQINAKFVFIEGPVLIESLPVKSSKDELTKLNKSIFEDDYESERIGAFIDLDNIFSALNLK